MTRKVNLLIQGSAVLVHISNIWDPLLSPKGKAYLSATVGTIQLLVAFIVHVYNPDGTSCRMPYKPID